MSSESFSSDIESLYCRNHQWLHKLLCRKLGNTFDAMDLAQDAFLRLMQIPYHFDSEPAARAYLRTMANGMCVDLWRRRQIEQTWLETLAARPENTAPSAEHQVMILQALHEIDSMLRNLPPKVAQVFLLSVTSEMTHKELAQKLGI